MKIVFIADKVKIQTGKADNSATVTFEIGEYGLEAIKELIIIRGIALSVTVEEYEEKSLHT